MEIIATHLGADFDALASALLARKLHPEARVFFPGSKEESVRRMLDGGSVREGRVGRLVVGRIVHAAILPTQAAVSRERTSSKPREGDC